MKTLLKNARELKGLKTRELAQLLQIDQALISKYENGTRKPPKEQVAKLSQALNIDFETLMIAWLKEKIISEIGVDDLAMKAMSLVLKDRAEYELLTPKLSINLEYLLNEIDVLKTKLENFR